MMDSGWHYINMKLFSVLPESMIGPWVGITDPFIKGILEYQYVQHKYTPDKIFEIQNRPE